MDCIVNATNRYLETCSKINNLSNSLRDGGAAVVVQVMNKLEIGRTCIAIASYTACLRAARAELMNFPDPIVPDLWLNDPRRYGYEVFSDFEISIGRAR